MKFIYLSGLGTFTLLALLLLAHSLLQLTHGDINGLNWIGKGVVLLGYSIYRGKTVIDNCYSLKRHWHRNAAKLATATFLYLIPLILAFTLLLAVIEQTVELPYINIALTSALFLLLSCYVAIEIINQLEDRYRRSREEIPS